MKLILAFEEIRDNHRAVVGGKAFALSEMARSGMNVPPGLCVTTEAYNDFVSSTGLQGQICMEWGRKRFEDMRWEEMWDVSLRIRNIFLNTPMSAALANALKGPTASTFSGKRVVVRSSAPHEDSARASFAGLHESFVNIGGMAPSWNVSGLCGHPYGQTGPCFTARNLGWTLKRVPWPW
jgi:pyruvate,water dikinase